MSLVSSSGVLATICTSVSPAFDRIAREMPAAPRPCTPRSCHVSRNRLSSCLAAVPRMRDMRVAPAFVQGVLLRQPAPAHLARRDAIGVAEVHAAGEREFAVDHDDLAVIALIEPRRSGRSSGFSGLKAHNATPASLEAVRGTLPRSSASPRRRTARRRARRVAPPARAGCSACGRREWPLRR